MTNPPAGWYPDPTGAPNTIRWWNGTQWTTRTEVENPAGDPTTSPQADGRETEEARHAEEARQVEEARAEDARRAEQARQAEEDRRAEEAREAGSRAAEEKTQPASAADGSPDGDEAEVTQTPPWDQGQATGPIPAWEQGQATGPTPSWEQGQVAGPIPAWDQHQQVDTPAWNESDTDQGQDGETSQVAWEQPETEQSGQKAPFWQQPDAEESAQSEDSWTHAESGQVSQASGSDQGGQGSWGQSGPAMPWSQGQGQSGAQPSWGQSQGEQPGSQASWDQGQGDQSGGQASWGQADSGQSGGQRSWDQGQGAQAGTQTAWGQWQGGAAATQTAWDQGQSKQGSTQTSWDQGQAGQTAWDQGQGGHTGTETSWDQGQSDGQHPWAQQGGQWSGGQFGQGPVQQAEPDDDDGGGGLKLPLLVAAAVVFVLLVAGGVWLILGRGTDEPQAQDSPDPTQAISPSDTPSATTTPGQSRNPSLHQGNRSAAEAISFPRQPPTKWSDRKRFAQAVIDSAGQYSVLQTKVDGKNDWYANIFVGALGTSILYNGNLHSTANDLAAELRSSFYDPIPVTTRQVSSKPIEVGGHKGWRIVQAISTKTKGVKSPNLYLTTAVFDLGDGTAVAYVSDIPANRADLRANEQAAFKGLHIG